MNIRSKFPKTTCTSHHAVLTWFYSTAQQTLAGGLTLSEVGELQKKTTKGNTALWLFHLPGDLMFGIKALMALLFISFTAPVNATMDCLTAFEYSSLCTSQSPTKFQQAYGGFYQETSSDLVITPIPIKKALDSQTLMPVRFSKNHSEDGNYQNYIVVAALPDLEMLLIQTQYYEGYSLTLVSYRNGGIYEIGGAPVLSPDKKHLLVYAEDIEAQYSANLLSVYKVGETGNGSELLQQYHSVGSYLDTVWGVRSARWLSNDKAEIEKIYIGEKSYIKSTHYLQNSETGWYEIKIKQQELNFP